MDSQTFELKANLTPRSIQCLQPLDSRQIMNRILSMGYETFRLNGALIEQFSKGAFLFVEEDVEFLLEAYLYLEKIIKTQDPYQHAACLNDGRFELMAISDRKMVKIEFTSCPDLNVANSVTFTITVSEDDYIWWWRSIANGILTIVGCI